MYNQALADAGQLVQELNICTVELQVLSHGWNTIPRASSLRGLILSFKVKNIAICNSVRLVCLVKQKIF